MRWAVVWLALLALILVPFALFEEHVNAIAARLLQPDVPVVYTAGVVVALLASDIVLPVPSSIVAAGAGVALGFWRGAASIWIGLMAGCLIAYAFGSWAAGAARRFVGDHGMARAELLSGRYGDYAIALCRPVPVLAEASVIFAGIVSWPFARFALVAGWSNLGVALGYAAIGAFSMQVESFLLAFAGSIAVPALALLLARLWLPLRSGDR